MTDKPLPFVRGPIQNTLVGDILMISIDGRCRVQVEVAGVTSAGTVQLRVWSEAKVVEG